MPDVKLYESIWLPNLIATNNWVNESSAAGIPAYWRGMGIVMHGAATCAPKVVDGHTVIPNAFIENICTSWPRYNRYNVYSEMVSQIINHGDWIAVPIDWDEQGYPLEALPLPANEVFTSLVENKVIHRWREWNFSPDQVIQISSPYGRPGVPRGIGVIEAHSLGINTNINQMKWLNSTAAGGGVPSAIAIPPSDIGREKAQEFREDWMEAHSTGELGIGVMGPGWDLKVMNQNMRDAQFNESMTLTTTFVAFMLNIDPSFLAATMPKGAEDDYANLSQRESGLLRDLSRWTTPIEQTLSRYVPAGEVKFQPQEYLKPTPKEQADYYAVLVTMGVLDAAEVREILGFTPRSGASE